MNFALLALKPSFGVLVAALIVGYSAIALALVSLFGMRETFGKDLDYVEGS